MHLTAESLIIILLIGAVAGWLAGLIVQGTGFGLVGDIVIGIVGALLAGLLFPALGIHFGAGIIAQIIAATLGAVILLIVARLVKSRSPGDRRAISAVSRKADIGVDVVTSRNIKRAQDRRSKALRADRPS